MKVLVTGAKGFVGKAVCAELRARGHKITEFDASVGHNILDINSLKQKMKGIDTVVHLAAIVENDKPNLWEVNVKGTTNVTKAAENAKVKKILFLSTTGVYGFTKGFVNEKSEARAENNYEKSKVEGEKIILETAKTNKVQGIVIRSAMVFGANKYWKSMFNLLAKKYPLPCNGKNTYQIIYVKELARAIALVLAKGKNGEIYLVSGKEKPTLKEFCETIQEELGMEKRINCIPTWLGLIIGKLSRTRLLTAENIRHLSKERNYDTKKIEKLGWKQKITLKKAIRETIKELKTKK